MDIASRSKKITEFLKKYKYAVLVLFIGLGLMLLPGKDGQKAAEKVQAEPISQVSITDQLAEILSKVAGAGEVQVLLTVRAGEETLYQTDDDIAVTENSNSTKIKTVLITTADKEETGLVRQVNPPVYLGAVIVCQGGDSPGVRLAIVDAVSKVTGLGSDRISVLKMK